MKKYKTTGLILLLILLINTILIWITKNEYLLISQAIIVIAVLIIGIIYDNKADDELKRNLRK